MVTRLTSSGDHGYRTKRLDFRRIRWLAVLLPALSVGLFEFLRHQWIGFMLPRWLDNGWPGNVAGALVVAAVVYGFVRFFTHVLQDSALEVARVREEAAIVVERQRIAREMHDSIAQTLFYLTVRLREVDDLVLAGESEEAHTELQMARREIKAAYHRVRAVIADLRQQAELEDFGKAVHRTASELAERLGVRVTCEVAGPTNLPPSSRQHVLAIIQEAVVNAHRHGQTRCAIVRLKTVGKETVIEVSDEGVGFDPGAIPQEGRYGLTIMEERAQMAGGRLDLDSVPGHGTRVTVYLPGASS